MQLSVVNAGRMPFGEALSLQQRLVEAVKAAPGERAYLVLLEHPPVLTTGRSGDDTDFLVDTSRLADEGIEVYEVSRGGRTTYHGPGQLVGYPVMALLDERRDVHKYLRSLEALLIGVLDEWGIKAGRREGLTGVWTDTGKVAAIGVALTRWVTYHGFSLNVDPNLSHFALIHPCGLREESVTSMADLLGRDVCVEDVVPNVLKQFCLEFGFDDFTNCEEDM